MSTVDLEDSSDIVIEIEVCYVLDGNRTSWNVCVGRCIPTSSCLERSSCRQNGKVGFRRASQLLLSIPKLGIVDDLHGWIVFDQREVACNRCSCSADLLADIVNSSLVGFFGNVNDALICYIRLGIYLADGALAVSDLPFTVGVSQLEVDDA